MKKRMLALVVFGTLLTFTLSLVHVPQASADLKSVFTAVCDAYTDAISNPNGPTPSGPSFCSSPPEDNCRSLMVCMNKAGWHVIHDTRYGGAWFDPSAPGAFYKLIFQKD